MCEVALSGRTGVEIRPLRKNFFMAPGDKHCCLSLYEKYIISMIYLKRIRRRKEIFSGVLPI
jgi:hypothetical protein